MIIKKNMNIKSKTPIYRKKKNYSKSVSLVAYFPYRISLPKV